jgi:hypothetical protein
MEEAIDPRPLAGSVILWIRIWMAVQIFYGLWAIWAAVMYPATGGASGYQVIDMGVGLLGLAMIGSFLVSGYLILRWVYRTNKNAHQFADGLAISPGWSVGWFFIPIANLWKPYEGMRETWQASHGGGNWPNIDVPDELRWWWGLWIGSNILSNLSFRLWSVEGSTGATTTSLYIDAFTSLLAIPLSLLLIGIVRTISDAQARMLDGSIFA